MFGISLEIQRGHARRVDRLGTRMIRKNAPPASAARAQLMSAAEVPVRKIAIPESSAGKDRAAARYPSAGRNPGADHEAENARALAIEVVGLSKSYAAPRGRTAKMALSGLDLAIPRGAIFGLLGPNGAGKSTFINILAGLVNKSAGRARIWGIDIDEAPRAARAAI
ncbi:MAG: ATP-binding cassette domain-containing protein, partial [Alphaproteobacteria bacterium]